MIGWWIHTPGKIKRAFTWLRDGLFPVSCVTCGTEGAILCAACKGAWDPPCIRRMGDRMASFAYADPTARGLLCAWKYDGSHEARDILLARARLTWETVQEWLRVEGVNAIAPLPLHVWKKRMRGFDQAEEIAQSLGSYGMIRIAHLLERKTFTDPQAQKTEADRKRSMQGNLFCATGPSPRTICLVDDVWTTGATCEAAIRALKAAGAEKVLLYTLCEG